MEHVYECWAERGGKCREDCSCPCHKKDAEKLDQVEDLIYEHQENLIRKRFGKEAASQANYGHGVNEMKDGISVETKIYGHGKLITTAEAPDDFAFFDEWVLH